MTALETFTAAQAARPREAMVTTVFAHVKPGAVVTQVSGRA